MNTWHCSFSLDHYREILLLALQLGGRLVQMRDCRTDLPSGRVLLLRHDIDFSVAAALRMAQVEHELGIPATYCVLLHSPTYNVGEPTTCQMLRELVQYGHEIALHYDLSFFQETGLDPINGINAEVLYLQSLIGAPVVSVAQHKPASSGQRVDFDGKYVDAYVQPFAGGLQYLSESGRSWRSACAHELLEAIPRLQLLTHPEWWSVDGRESTFEIIRQIAEGRQTEIHVGMAEYSAGLEMYLRNRSHLDKAWKQSGPTQRTAGTPAAAP